MEKIQENFEWCLQNLGLICSKKIDSTIFQNIIQQLFPFSFYKFSEVIDKNIKRVSTQSTKYSNSLIHAEAPEPAEEKSTEGSVNRGNFRS